MAVHSKILQQIKKVKGKRALAVINHILKHGQVTTEELREQYGYEHPPRARMDVLECGIPLKTVRVSNKAGTRKIAAYGFGDPDDVEKHKTGGRQPFSKRFKNQLYERQDGRCAFTGVRYEPRYLSIDHRVPYQVAGDEAAPECNPDAFMLVAIGLQRVKSWCCEHCENSTELRDPATCQRCYWADPDDYDHIAMQPQRRVDLVWKDKEVADFDRIAGVAKKRHLSVAEFLKEAGLRAISR